MRLWLVLAALGASAALFCLWPGLDIAVASLFFDGTGFPAQSNPVVETLRQAFYWAEDGAGFAALPLAALAWVRGKTVLTQNARRWLFQGLVFLLGPALLVNGILKPVWARPRPFQVADFGGAAAFQPIWQIGGTCTGSCSFTSGEMAGATALSIMAWQLAGPRPLARFAAILPMVFTFWQRMAAGRHFLSDMVFSALAVALIALILQAVLDPGRG